MKRAEVIHAELERIRKKHGGRLTRQIVVDEARSNKKSALHREFNWNINQAAMKHWLERAQELISQYVTVRVVDRKTTIRAPMYVRDPTLPKNVGGYVSVQDKLARGTATKIIDAELERIESCVERGRNVSHALDLQHAGLAAYFEEMLKIVAAAKKLLEAAE